MIFGPLYASGFKNAAKKAAELRVPMISPITQQNKILFNNIYVSKTNPSQFTLLESLADYCLDSLLQQNCRFLITVSEKDKREWVFAQAFKKYFNDKLIQAGRLADSVQIAKGLEGVKLLHKPDGKNVVIMLSYNQVFIADFTTQLAQFAVNKEMILCGWESVTGMDNIDQEYLNQLRFTFPHQFNETNQGAFKRQSEDYKSKQGTYPNEYYYIGFDVAYYYLKNLKEQGPDFIYRLDELPLETSYMRFRFTRPDRATGFDNRGVYIFRYSNYELAKTGWR
jgi:ABC-type branched-subunit amino acid transport system substrate-binding protein